MDAKTTATVTRSVARAAMGLTITVGVLAFVLSFSALRDLAVMSGIPPSLSFAWPIVVDGGATCAALAVFALSKGSRRERAYPWVLLVLAVAVSVAGNAVHAAGWGDSGLPVAVKVAVGAVPPAFLAALTHLAQTLTSRAVSAPQRARSDKNTKPVAAPERTAAQATETTERSAAPAWLTAARPVSVTPAMASEPVSEQPLTEEATADGMVAWVIERLSANEQVSGTDVAERFGVSSATGRRRIAQARELMSAQEDLTA